MKPRIDSGEQRRQRMNWNKAGNNLEEFKQRVQEHWKSLSDEQVDAVAGRRELLAQELQRAYGLTPTEAEAEIRDFESGDPSITGFGSGRGPTERSREFGSGNAQGGGPRNDKHQLH